MTVDEREILSQISEKLDRIEHRFNTVVFGNGHDGLVTRVDRLEQDKQRHVSEFKSVWALIVAIVGHLGWSIFSYWHK